MLLSPDFIVVRFIPSLYTSDVPARPESHGPGQAKPSQAVKSRALTFGLRRLLARLQIFQALSRSFRPGLFSYFSQVFNVIFCEISQPICTLLNDQNSLFNILSVNSSSGTLLALSFHFGTLIFNYQSSFGTPFQLLVIV